MQSLNNNDVRYLVVGGYAVAVHGYPRYTKDIDIWIDRTPENVKRLLHALEDFGFGSLGLTAKDFLEPDIIVHLGYPPNRIDILTSLPGVKFEECFAEKTTVRVEDLDVYFVGRECLKRTKSASGRPQDLADLENLDLI